jgi:hypothetical protein
MDALTRFHDEILRRLELFEIAADHDASDPYSSGKRTQRLARKLGVIQRRQGGMRELFSKALQSARADGVVLAVQPILKAILDSYENMMLLFYIGLPVYAPYPQPCIPMLESELNRLRLYLPVPVNKSVSRAATETPAEYRDYARPNGIPLTAEYVSRSETYNLSPTYLSNHKDEISRIKVGRAYVYKYEQIAAHSLKRNAQEDPGH